MAKEGKTVVRYSLSFKQQIVKELEDEGESYGSLRRRYGIQGGQTIQNWVRKFGKNQLLNKVVKVETVGEKDRLKAMQAEIKKLKEALADSHLEKRCLEELIKEANKLYNTDLKKNFGEKSSNDSQQNSQ
ncbi:MAG TPA: transposase [Chitinophagaceae bacterium]